MSITIECAEPGSSALIAGIIVAALVGSLESPDITITGDRLDKRRVTGHNRPIEVVAIEYYPEVEA